MQAFVQKTASQAISDSEEVATTPSLFLGENNRPVMAVCILGDAKSRIAGGRYISISGLEAVHHRANSTANRRLYNTGA
jgi:hypothetical protein